MSNHSLKLYATIQSGDIIKCQNAICNEKVRIHFYNGDLCKFRCAKCLGKDYINPGNMVPARNYTTCTVCTSQFMVMDNFYGKVPKCKTCRTLTITIPNIELFSPCCKTCHKIGPDVTFDAEPYALEIYNDNTPVWMCKNCRYESYMDT